MAPLGITLFRTKLPAHRNSRPGPPGAAPFERAVVPADYSWPSTSQNRPIVGGAKGVTEHRFLEHVDLRAEFVHGRLEHCVLRMPSTPSARDAWRPEAPVEGRAG